MTQPLVLASASPYRRQILQNAGLKVDVSPAAIDERAVESTLEGSNATPDDIAAVLAEAKALAVSAERPDAVVIGSDQTLSLDGTVLHKPADMEEARRRLLQLSGRSHELNSAVVLASEGIILWRHVAIAHMTMRRLEPGFVGRHLSRVGNRALSSVGAYQIEGEGVQLFEAVDGDFFAIMGLPLLPLLAELRRRDLIDG